ncbi:MAG: HAD family phosphatase [Planctomycetota bacterium]|nr:HAD family phosphatase [Planctomycetaceae bacterium]MDQ3330642.1 HAD family phosphatase [Planctomycetota bacterium]
MVVSKPFGVIFDVDGVLIDSYDPHFQSWREIASGYGVDYTEAMFAYGFGRTSREIVATQWNRTDLTEAQIREIDDAKEAAYRRIVAAAFPAMPGARDLVAALHTAGFKVAVGSSGPPENVDLAIEKLGLAAWLDGKVTGRDVTRGKPDPQVFLIAAEKLGVPPERCAVVEDAPAGIEAAHAAGMACVGFPSTGRTLDDVKAADLIVHSLAELSPEAFRELIGRHAR